MTDFRVGYLYSLAPIHCGGEGDLGNILDIAREVHTGFPYIPGSSLRGSLRNEVALADAQQADLLFGKELSDGEQMGVHQVWFGDARLLWVPMRTMSKSNQDVFTWVSCHSLIRDRALVSRRPCPALPNEPVGTRSGDFHVADARIQVKAISDELAAAVDLGGHWPEALQGSVADTWKRNHIILPDIDFRVLMEHSLWTQIRNKIQEDTPENAGGSAEVFWTDICIPRDTIFYYPWGYSNATEGTAAGHQTLIETLTGLIQVGGQANVGRGWVQSWVEQAEAPSVKQAIAVGA